MTKASEYMKNLRSQKLDIENKKAKEELNKDVDAGVALIEELVLSSDVDCLNEWEKLSSHISLLI